MVYIQITTVFPKLQTGVKKPVYAIHEIHKQERINNEAIMFIIVQKTTERQRSHNR